MQIPEWNILFLTLYYTNERRNKRYAQIKNIPFEMWMMFDYSQNIKKKFP